MSRTLWAWVLLAATLAFVSSPLLVPGFGGYEPGQFPVPQTQPPVQPAGYAFAIWGPIYLWLAVSAIFGAWKRRQAVDWAPMRPALALSVGIGAAWLPVAMESPLAATLLIWVMLATALAPWAGAALADVLGGYPAVFVVLAGVSVLAAVCAVGSVPRDAPAPPGR